MHAGPRLLAESVAISWETAVGKFQVIFFFKQSIKMYSSNLTPRFKKFLQKDAQKCCYEALTTTFITNHSYVLKSYVVCQFSIFFTELLYAFTQSMKVHPICCYNQVFKLYK